VRQNIVSLPKYPCSFCKRNEATQLCDLGNRLLLDECQGSERKNSWWLTSNMRLPDMNDCAVNVNSFEFRPSCNDLHKTIQEKHDKRKCRLLIDSVFGKENDK
jgi:hypothetical protein